MVRFALIALLAAAPAAAQVAGPAAPGTPRTIAATPAAEVSREAAVNGVLTLYGNQRCPTNRSGEEIVVCVRRPAAEQFRIPKELREFAVTPQNESWAKSVVATSDVGATGIGSCSAVGPGGATGCLAQEIRGAKRETKAREKAATPDLSPY